ncbi:hypothetical protein ACGFIW_01160 [Micromonospora sp. NPDC048935]|uniref:hypothetical protein n=1 Tax=Micromonospora sp. NPDC048935 TaxID=3364262 RepID=UPI00371CDAF5
MSTETKTIKERLMLIIRGKSRGRTARPRQFANDWISVDYTDEAGGHGIVKPGQVQLETAEERALFATTNRGVVGNFWRMWALNPDGTFRSLNPPPLARRQAGRQR